MICKLTLNDIRIHLLLTNILMKNKSQTFTFDKQLRNHYKSVAYMCAYFSISEDEASEVMKHVRMEVTKETLNVFDEMQAISKAFGTKIECFVQEAVYPIVPELWFRKRFPRVVFPNSNLPEDKYRV